MEALAKQSGSIISAVMLGTIAGCGRLPLTAEQFEAAIRADGKAVENNLRGFRAGLEAARARLRRSSRASEKAAPKTPAVARARSRLFVAAVAQAIAVEGVRRLIAYQGVRLRAALSRPAARR